MPILYGKQKMDDPDLGKRLELIASNYHLQSGPDMFIEKMCQEFELKWIMGKIPPNAKVLELGYGDGVTFEKLAPYVDLTVVEGSKQIFEKARSILKEKQLSAKIIHSYFENFEPSEKYDYVFASHVLEHVDDPQLIMARIKSWLLPAGICIIIVPNKESIHRRVAVKMGIQKQLDSLSPRDHIVGHLRVYSVETMLKLISEVGMVALETRGFFLKPFANGQLLNLDPSVITGLCELSQELPPEMCANIAFLTMVQ